MENTETQEVTNETEQSTPSWSFVTEQEVAEARSSEPSTVAPEVTPQEENITEAAPEQTQKEEPVQDTPPVQETISNTAEKESRAINDDDVLSYLSEKLGRDFNSFEDISSNTNAEAQIEDERLQAIAQFVEETGRAPQDWFAYQQLDTSEMDDFTAVSVKMAADYPNLSQEELNTLIGSKYKLNSDLHSEEEVKLSQLQLKLDSADARKGIEEIRNRYRAPEPSNEPDSPIDDEWISSMKSNLDALEGIEFDLGNEQSFTFGLNNDYKSELADKNTRLDEYFDPYVQQDGSWDYDKLNMHRAVVDNIETIIQSVYRQGQSDGQRNIVDRAANIDSKSPNQGNVQPNTNSLTEQLKEAMGGGSRMKFL
tara:strand:- start:6409 stop:7512 length:1104 start_codon:yes stop_codon:yes gene_type:complete